MLVLSRRTNQEIVIPGLGVTLRVLKVKGGSVSLGVTAPREVRITRGELHNRPLSDCRQNSAITAQHSGAA